jgi:hypothetical protein
MLSVINAECHTQALYAECHYAKCRNAECRYAECRGAFSREHLMFNRVTSVDFASLGPYSRHLSFFVTYK